MSDQKNPGNKEKMAIKGEKETTHTHIQGTNLPLLLFLPLPIKTSSLDHTTHPTIMTLLPQI